MANCPSAAYNAAMQSLKPPRKTKRENRSRHAQGWRASLLGLVAGLMGFSLSAREIVINVDGKSEGRVFEGIGALSAGASSRLLLDYPEPYRTDILDFLFKPKFGAGLQHLKVEIGGDVNSTDGSEPSHAMSREEFEHPQPEYFQRGYEWWLMEEARKRNPSIPLETLQWGAPGWIGNGNFYARDNADFIVAFIKGAKQYHKLDINFQGVRNEIRYDTEWIKLLRKTLDDNGLASVKICAADQFHPEAQWAIADDMLKDASLSNAISVLDAHIPEMLNFYTTVNARKTNKPLWDGEAHAYGGDWYAAADCARYNNRAYIQGRITKLIYWSVITSYHDYLPAPKSGIMRANTPWSGYYEVQPPLWMIAHTAQFAEPGWRYLDRACRFFWDISGLSKQGFSVVALKSNRSDDYSLIIETMDAKEPQQVRFKISDDLSHRDLALWRSVFKQEVFVRQKDVALSNGEFTLKLVPNAVYSLSTTRGQQKGEPAHAIPKPQAFPFPFTADFEADEVGKPAKSFCDLDGAFAVVPRPDGGGKCHKQMVTQQGIRWSGRYPLPKTIVGDIGWTNYEVSADVMLPGAGAVKLWGRDHDFMAKSESAGCRFEVNQDGAWLLQIQDKVLASGKVNALGNRWHTVSIALQNDQITLAFDHETLAKTSASSISAGLVALGTDFNKAFFDNLKVSRLR